MFEIVENVLGSDGELLGLAHKFSFLLCLPPLLATGDRSNVNINVSYVFSMWSFETASNAGGGAECDPEIP